MPWLTKVKAVLNMHLGGQAMGSAVSELLYGIENPSGKLTETFPECIENNPAFLAYPDYNRKVSYTEEVFVGYRYYDIKKIKPLFPFGFGLSYTEFEYSNLSVSKEKATDEEEIQVQFTVTNIGKLSGKEIPELYIHDAKSTIRRPYKELKGFEKIYLNPSERKQVTIVLNKKSFAYYNVDIHDWYVEGGIYEILIGSSSSDVKLRKSIEIWPVKPIKVSYTLDSTIEEILNDEGREKDAERIIRELLGDMPEFLKNGTFRNMLNFPMCRCTEDEMQKAIDMINQI
jgi:beta-glucosidase